MAGMRAVGVEGSVVRQAGRKMRSVAVVSAWALFQGIALTID